jgi:photosynthetic reaction center cytochrome c subunit
MRTRTLKLAIPALLAALLLAACERPPVSTTQQGYRGLGMVDVANPRTLEAMQRANVLPEPLPAAPSGGPLASATYKNVQVLGDLSVAEFTRLMVAITNWVSPKEGCNYCHAGGDFAADTPYTKVVARRMLEMTKTINASWKSHVGDTGVTCYTCHRGKPVPEQIWFAELGPRTALGPAGNRAGQNAPAEQVGLTSLPYDPFLSYLLNRDEIRVASTTALPAKAGASIQATESTYALMMHMSKALGTNCTLCHNSRSFFDWDQSTEQRVTAWHGIRMVREMNAQFLEPLAPQYPASRLGAMGDAPKANCATCHQGAPKPLYGASMLKDHPELAGAKKVAAASNKP